VAFSPDGAMVAAGSLDHTVTLWDVATRKLRHKLTGHNSYVLTVAFSPDGHWLASGSAHGVVRLWDTASGRPLQLMETRRGHSLPRLQPRRPPLGVRQSRRKREDLDPASGELTATLIGEQASEQPTVTVIQPRRQLLACVALIGRNRHLEPGHQPAERTMRAGSTQPHVFAVAFGPDSKWVGSGGGPAR